MKVYVISANVVGETLRSKAAELAAGHEPCNTRYPIEDVM
jgi:hypothetical protein